MGGHAAAVAAPAAAPAAPAASWRRRQLGARKAGSMARKAGGSEKRKARDLMDEADDGSNSTRGSTPQICRGARAPLS